MKFTGQFYITGKLLTQALTLVLCLGLPLSFHGGFSAKSELGKNITEKFDENSDASESEENSKPQDLALNHDGNYSVLKISAKNSGFANHLPVSGFTLSIATPPPNFRS